MKERIAVVSGYRSAMGKAGGAFKNIEADDLGASVLREVLVRSGIDKNVIDEVIIGNVAQPSHAANIARVIALKAGIDEKVPAYTVHRNCASGMEAMTTAMSKIQNGEADVIVAGGVESMSNIPLMYGKKMTEFFAKLAKSRSVGQKLAVLFSFRLSFLKPVIGLVQGLTDPVSDLIMGCTAENIAKDFSITRQEQDEFALNSHKKAEAAIRNKIFSEEIVSIFNCDSKKSEMVLEDEGVRKGQTIEALEKLRPYFEKGTGTVTVGNSSQITDGAAFAILMSEKKAQNLAKEGELEILGYIKDFAYAGLDPSRMGLGPVFAMERLFKKTKVGVKDVDLFEINEAFAAQVLGCQKAMASKEFAKKHFGRAKEIGAINDEILNVNGGAVALGHPVGMSGARIIIHLLRELKRRGKNCGVASLCIGGGQGGAVLLEVN
ncbi:MAG: thiolase family protein [Rickettsiales bacterium]|nr:thiolase family protein [Rickettsiales bacterium]